MNQIIQHLYDRYINTLPIKKISPYFLIYVIWKRFFQKFDPIIQVKIGEKSLFINLSHNLPLFYSQFPNYDRALPRICKKIKEIDNKLDFIDIGANIGDTICLISDQVDGNFLCIEGDTMYISLLEKNAKLIPSHSRVRIEKSYCGKKIKNNISIHRKAGTARLTKSRGLLSKDEVDKNNIKTLEQIIECNSDFGRANMLKIDTDGFEIDILDSGKEFLSRSKPLLYCEFTPELYIKNGYLPNRFFEILTESGYEQGLFYDNFGNPMVILDMKNRTEIENMIQKIDKKNIWYYDILICHRETTRYREILESELHEYSYLIKNL